MKKVFSLSVLSLFLSLSSAGQTLFSLPEQRPAPHREVRAVWLTTLKGLDWPKQPAVTATDTERQKKELVKILDQLQKAGINTVLFQSRIRATTAYPSDIEPWDGIFTGTPGKAPGYDPLQLALDECHRRGMELHAWVVAYPICDVDVARKLGKKALPQRHPQLCLRCGDKWMMDPGVPGTDDYIANICQEIVTKYEVDGIHLDYIRYPERGVPFNDNRSYRKYGKRKNKNDWRRENVTRAVQKIHQAVKTVRPWIKISCSPVGKYADLAQQSSYGWNARDAVHQEAQNWLRDGLMDMLFPMMYFDGKHFYPFIQDWQDHSYGRQIVTGLGTYLLHPHQKDWELNNLRRQMFFTRDIGAAGHAQFRSLFFTDNVKGIYDFAQGDLYHQPALPPAMTWEDDIAPSIPEVRIKSNPLTLDMTWEPSVDNSPKTPVHYNIYYCPDDTFSFSRAEVLAYGVTENKFSHLPALPTRRYGYYAVTAVDAYGNESMGKPVTARPALHSQMNKVTRNSRLEVPPVDGAEFLLISDITGRNLQTITFSTSISVDLLSPGYYEIRTLGKKGKSHHLFNFWKE